MPAMKKMPTKRVFSKGNVTDDALSFSLSFDNEQGAWVPWLAVWRRAMLDLVGWWCACKWRGWLLNVYALLAGRPGFCIETMFTTLLPYGYA